MQEISPFGKKCRSGGCPRQLKRASSPELVHGKNPNDSSFLSLDSSADDSAGVQGTFFDEFARCFDACGPNNDAAAAKNSAAFTTPQKSNGKHRELPPPSPASSLSGLVDNALTKFTDAMFDSMGLAGCGLESTCQEWMGKSKGSVHCFTAGK